ncbi:hypothetical protein FZEAL_7097 [Fusarium zealandicum]|uniref:Uncharacterized protein n=1 Tax=Fusarium zealandicum TaxID=1053134 RepID=A0A8H4UHB7_9HYPO|nr:hypothetical protein FZEAL_7097 [Fusarium zealandicum]
MHHSRRKSGHGLANTTSTEARKTVSATDPTKYKRPAMTRRHTPQKLGRSQRDRERERTESWEDERESFPQFCCRRVDQTATSQSASSVRHYASVNYPFYSTGNPEPRDIIPRASPSRPSSMLLSSPPTTPGTGAAAYQHTSALSALRSLNARPPSPPSPTGSSSNLWPFSRSAATSPHNSYSRPSAAYFSSTYDGGYYGSSGYTYDGMDRPLPSRHPGGYSRPKSIELVTPMVGR